MNTSQSMPRSYSYTPANISLTGFASAVTGASWPLTATVAGDSLAHRVTIQNNSGNSKAGINIVIVGTGPNGEAQTETLAGPAGSATVTSVKYFLTLTSVTPASTWGADTGNIGWAGQFASAWINVNWLAEDILSLIVDVSGTINFALNQTFDLYDQPGVTARWFAFATAQTADGIWQTVGGATAVQFIANSYSNGATVVLNANATKVANAPDGTAGSGTAVTIADGASVTLGTIADGAATQGSTGTISAKLRTVTAQLNTIAAGTAAGLGQTTMAASVPVAIASNQSTLNVQQVGYSFQNITTSTTTVVKSGAGVLHIVNVNTLGTVASIVTIYDNTAGSGTKIGTINSLTLSGAFQFDIAFATGLTLVTTGAPDITVSYR